MNTGDEIPDAKMLRPYMVDGMELIVATSALEALEFYRSVMSSPDKHYEVYEVDQKIDLWGSTLFELIHWNMIGGRVTPYTLESGTGLVDEDPEVEE